MTDHEEMLVRITVEAVKLYATADEVLEFMETPQDWLSGNTPRLAATEGCGQVVLDHLKEC